MLWTSWALASWPLPPHCPLPKRHGMCGTCPWQYQAATPAMKLRVGGVREHFCWGRKSCTSCKLPNCNRWTDGNGRWEVAKKHCFNRTRTMQSGRNKLKDLDQASFSTLTRLLAPCQVGMMRMKRWLPWLNKKRHFSAIIHDHRKVIKTTIWVRCYC